MRKTLSRTRPALIAIFFAWTGLGFAPGEPSDGILLGAWIAPGSPDAVQRVERELGVSFAISHRYYTWLDSFPGQSEIWDQSVGKQSLITWEPFGVTLQQIARGDQDDVIRKRAKAFRDFAHPVFLRFAHEMNGNWYPWGGAYPKTFKEAWKRIHRIFREEGASNVVWVWCPNVMSVPQESWNRAEAYYPGNEYVDWIGVDGYNWGNTQKWSRWLDFSEIFEGFYKQFADLKPIMIAETSSAEGGGNKAEWIARMRHSLKTDFPKVKALIWFQEEKEVDWRVNSSEASRRAFQEFAADPELIRTDVRQSAKSPLLKSTAVR